MLHWRKLRGTPHASEKARAAVAAKFERDVRANPDQITLFDNTTGETFKATPEILDDVDWVSIADKCLGRFQDYKELPRLRRDLLTVARELLEDFERAAPEN